MNTVKHLRKSSLPSLQKKQYSSDKNNSRNAYITAVLFASLVGTYLDLFFVGKELYTFPARPFSDIFSINIVFTLFILPLFTALFLFVATKVGPYIRVSIIFMISVMGFFIEQYTEKIGWFTHHGKWNHLYSFWGYIIFWIVIWRFYRWMMDFD
ncbi:CBO0543 family protein [Priestia abyssalis]|uniref:CBO0543 family protein n=1 Tax=Priestia abyssalis TaxID=1221450 RepID=UPI0038B62970